MEGDEETLQRSKKCLEDTANGSQGSPFEATILESIKLVEANLGHFRMTFIVPQNLADQNGNWHEGAIASLVDTVGAFVLSSITGSSIITVDFNISYYSSARIHEEVEIEAKVAGQKGKLLSAVVEVRKKDDGRKVALGKLWMTSVSKTTPSDNGNKILPSNASKI